MPKKTARVIKKTAHKTTKDLSFEKALERLETIVTQLEAAEAPLEKALNLYEEGVGLARYCSQQLKTAERKVELLEDKNNELGGRPFAHAAEEYAANAGLEEEDADYEEEEKDRENEDDEEDYSEGEETQNAVPQNGEADEEDEQEQLF